MKVYVRMVYDFCGNLIVEVEIIIENGFFRVIVLFGVFIGIYEVVEFRDGNKFEWMGKGVIKVVSNVNSIIGFVLIKFDLCVINQKGIDEFMILLDGIFNKLRLGVNVIFGVFLCVV